VFKGVSAREVSPESAKDPHTSAESIFMQAGLHILAVADFLLKGYGDFAGRPTKNCSLTR